MSLLFLAGIVALVVACVLGVLALEVMNRVRGSSFKSMGMKIFLANALGAAAAIMLIIAVILLASNYGPR